MIDITAVEMRKKAGNLHSYNIKEQCKMITKSIEESAERGEYSCEEYIAEPLYDEVIKAFRTKGFEVVEVEERDGEFFYRFKW